MSIIQTLAIVTCLMSIVSKWFFSHRLSTLNKLLALEKRSYIIAKKEGKLTNQAYQKAAGQEKQLEAECKSLRRTLAQINLVYNQIIDAQAKTKKKVEDQRRELESMG